MASLARLIILPTAIAALLTPLSAEGALAQIFTTAPPRLHGMAPAPAPASPPRLSPEATAQDAAGARQQPAAPPRQLAIPGFPAALDSRPMPGSRFEAAAPRPEPAPSGAQRPAAAATAPASAPPVFAAPSPSLSPEPSRPAAQAAPPNAPPQVAAAQSPARVIRHLTNNIQGFRLSGEIGSSEWPIYFTQAQTQDRLQFQVGYLAAVSVMPEASYLKLVINDTLVGRANIQPTQGVRTITFDIPAGLVQPGFNSIRLTAEQHHRVDCSLDATYELWTQVDPGKTGFVLPVGDLGATGIEDLAALPPDEQGALPIRIVMAGKTTPEHIERVIRAAQIISIVGRFEQPVVDVGPLASGQYGINLVIGQANAINDILLQARTGPVTSPRAIIVPASAGRKTTVIITGRDDAEVDAAFAQMALATQMRGTTAGLRAARAFPGYRLEGGQRVKLRDLGITSQEFSGRLFRAGFNVIMPPDFYAADYGKATFDLAGGYAGGLTNAAQIIVSVNGRNAVNQKMPKYNGEVFKQNPIPLQLGHLRPGLNRIEIEAQVPVPEDQACDPLAAINGRKRFLFLDTTEIELPRIARIARVPDLAITATGGFPFVNASMRPNLFVPQPDRYSIGASATIAAHLAIAAGSPIDFRFTVS